MAARRDTAQTEADIAEKGLGFIADSPFRPDQLDYEIVMALGWVGQIGISVEGVPESASPETEVRFYIARPEIGADIVVSTFAMHIPDPMWRMPGEIPGTAHGLDSIIQKAQEETTLSNDELQVAVRALLLDFKQRNEG